MSNMRSEYKQPFRSTNDAVNRRIPVVFYGVFQHPQEAHAIRDEWKGNVGTFVRCYERRVRVDNLHLYVHVVVVRRP